MITAIIGLVLGMIIIRAGCRFFDIPSLAHPRLIGAFPPRDDTWFRSGWSVATSWTLDSAKARSRANGEAMKATIGLVLALLVGFGCRAFGMPSPAPPMIMGALLVVAMTVGYTAVDRVITPPMQHARDCGGPSGIAASQIRAV
jgi:XapX domain-containing protein